MIILKNVTLRRSSKVLLDKASVTINPGEKVGLVGRNGAGKSTLFALLNGTLHEDGGDYSIPKQWQMGQVAQDMPETDQSATDFVVEGDTALLAAQQEVAAAEAADDYDRMAHAYTALHDAGAHDAPARAQALTRDADREIVEPVAVEVPRREVRHPGRYGDIHARAEGDVAERVGAQVVLQPPEQRLFPGGQPVRHGGRRSAATVSCTWTALGSRCLPEKNTTNAAFISTTSSLPAMSPWNRSP